MRTETNWPGSADKEPILSPRKLELNPLAESVINRDQAENGKKTKVIEWKGSRKLNEVNIEGKMMRVAYMRDGIVEFEDGTFATYERINDYPGLDLGDFHKIRLTYTTE